ncbi:MAG: phosphatidate cytidylyltransferase [Ferrovibrio sp.]|nr:phosphatidate cytidylyltransferase [Ferrovibrio sp.]
MAAAMAETPAAAGWLGSALTKRILSALVMLPLALAALWFGKWIFAGLVALAAVLMLREWQRLPDGPENQAAPDAKALALGGAALVLAIALMRLDQRLASFIVLLFGALAYLWLQPARRRWAFGGMVYVGLPSLSLIWLRDQPEHGRLIVFWLLLVVWATDTGAYAFGRLIGGPKLIPAISPNKTWAGLLGGMLCAALAGFGVAQLEPGLPALLLGLFAALVAVVSQAGDFFESGAKRRFGVKDSGALIPGHGGALDRLDGVLFAAPFVAFGLLLWNGWGLS